MADYDVKKAFAKIENELIESMIRNMKRHRAEEKEEGYQWEQWQAVQLRALDDYRKKHATELGERYTLINQKINAAILEAKAQGGMAQERKILHAVKEGLNVRKPSEKIVGEFFSVNERKMNALLDAVQNDMEKAEGAILRKHNDECRKAIFDAQVYANSGAGTYEKAVDMAVKDYISNGINCIVYSNGRRVNIKDYADMALRTASKRAYLAGEGEKRQEWGVHTVIMNKRGNPCPKCLPWVGRVLIDDVWSGGTAEESSQMGYPLMSAAMAAGLYHPNCRDSHTTYFEGISTPPSKKWKKEELEEIEQKYKQEQKASHAEKQAEKFARLEKNALDEDNKKLYGARRREWGNKTGITGNNIAKFAKTAIIQSGGISGGRNPAGTRAAEHARKYYDLVRSMTTDVKKISETTGHSEQKIAEVKNYIFMEKHNLGKKEPQYFEPDYMMAESWRRLIDGKPEKHDYTLINHEILERVLVKNGKTQEEAHIEASKKYNYSKEANEYYGKIKKYKKD